MAGVFAVSHVFLSFTSCSSEIFKTSIIGHHIVFSSKFVIQIGIYVHTVGFFLYQNDLLYSMYTIEKFSLSCNVHHHCLSDGMVTQIYIGINASIST